MLGEFGAVKWSSLSFSRLSYSRPSFLFFLAFSFFFFLSLSLSLCLSPLFSLSFSLIPSLSFFSLSPSVQHVEHPRHLDGRRLSRVQCLRGQGCLRNIHLCHSNKTPACWLSLKPLPRKTESGCALLKEQKKRKENLI